MVNNAGSAIKPSILAAIGNTLLIRLRRAFGEMGCEILGKAEFLNPGQSVKDRAALFIIEYPLPAENVQSIVPARQGLARPALARRGADPAGRLQVAIESSSRR